jgi:hypothetical protein
VRKARAGGKTAGTQTDSVVDDEGKQGIYISKVKETCIIQAMPLVVLKLVIGIYRAYIEHILLTKCGA